MPVLEEHLANISSLCSEFQMLSRLPVTGELDGATLRQMSEPRCGVSDEGSQHIWAQRVNAIFTGKSAAVRRPQRRRGRSAAQGIVCYVYIIETPFLHEYLYERACMFLCSEDLTEIFASVCKL